MPSKHREIRWLLWSSIIFIILRIAIITAEYQIGGGTEFAMDPWNFELGAKPLSVIEFENSISGYSQPPLYPIVISPLYFALSGIFGDFLAPRIAFSILEFIGFLLVALFLKESSEFINRDKFKIMTIMATSPLGFMAGAVMKQEEAIVMIFTAAVLLAWKRGSLKAASVLTFLAMITAKILFAIAFLPLLFISKERRDIIIYGILPSIIFFFLYGLIGYFKTGTTPYIDFSPQIVGFCVGFYSLLTRFVYISGPAMKWSSLVIMAVVFLLAYLYRNKMINKDFPLMFLFSFCVMFMVFYHVNMEYHIFFLPLLAVVPFMPYARRQRKKLIAAHYIFGFSSWAFGIVYGIRAYSEGVSLYSRSKQLILDLYNSLFGFISPYNMETYTLIIALISLSLVTYLAARLIFERG